MGKRGFGDLARTETSHGRAIKGQPARLLSLLSGWGAPGEIRTMSELPALILSCIYVFAVIGAATLLQRFGTLRPAAARKVVHIGAAHWWFFLLAFFRSPAVMLAGPIGFVAVNWLSHRLRLFRVMEDASSPKSYGTIYFPLSLAVLVSFVIVGIMPAWIAGIGVLVMGWGDGLAAVVGQRSTRRERPGDEEKAARKRAKTARGSAAMFLASFAVVAIMTAAFGPRMGAAELLSRSLATALFAAMVELATPLGADNLTVPILTALFYRFAAEGGASLAFSGAAVFNILAAAAAYRARALSEDGAVAAACVGTALLVSGGFPAYALLMVFFLSSNAIGRATRSRVPPSGIEEKGDRRDALQVLANSGSALAALVLHVVFKHGAFLVAFGAALAAANADTWASELGILSRRPPRHLLSGQELPAGTSGAVSLLGFLSSALGALLVGFFFFLLYLPPMRSVGLAQRAVVVVIAAGFLGSLVDSLLGATVQAQYRSADAGKLTERPFEGGRPNRLERGLSWVSNDTVNAAATLAAGAAAAAAYALL